MIRRGALQFALALLATLILLAPEGRGGTLTDPLLDLRVWAMRWAKTEQALNASDAQTLRALLDEVRVLGETRPERAREIDLALLDLAALDPPPLGPREAGDPETLREIALAEVERRIGRGEEDEIVRWLAAEVVDDPRIHETPRRLAALELLRGRYREPIRRPLMRASSDPEREIRQAALRALAGWPAPVVHLFFLERIERDSLAIGTAADHLDRVRGQLGPLALDQLRTTVGRLYVSDDWRDAARARQVVGFLDPPRAVPILIESLTVWQARTASGTGSKRIEHEILGELRRISGRSLGPVVPQWREWWKAVRSGRVLLPEFDSAGAENYSAATFFGLRPMTDRVIFVVDRSGSMEAAFGTDGRSRYQEAIDQLFRFLEQSGQETRFGLVLFHDRASRWRNRLSPATPTTLGQARRWLEGKTPAGATHLREGLRKALDAGRDGALEVEKIEADTIVILCDGATAEGPVWVRPWLAKVNGEAMMTYHCALIGSGGDGTLEALAEGSEGDFVRVE